MTPGGVAHAPGASERRAPSTAPQGRPPLHHSSHTTHMSAAASMPSTGHWKRRSAAADPRGGAGWPMERDMSSGGGVGDARGRVWGGPRAGGGEHAAARGLRERCSRRPTPALFTPPAGARRAGAVGLLHPAACAPCRAWAASRDVRVFAVRPSSRRRRPVCRLVRQRNWRRLRAAAAGGARVWRRRRLLWRPSTGPVARRRL